MHKEDGSTPKDEFHWGHHVPFLQENVEDRQLDDHREEELDAVGRCSILLMFHPVKPDSAVHDRADEPSSEKQRAFKNVVNVINR